MTRRLVALVAAVAVVAGVAVYVLRDGDGGLDRVGSREIDGDQALPLGDEPAGYRIVYVIHEVDAAPTSEVVEVERPFNSTRTTYATADAQGQPVSVQRSAFGRVELGGGDAASQVLAVGPLVAGADLRIATVLDDALERGWLERREQREVAGRRCQVYRAATSVIGGGLAEPLADAQEHTDACFDEAGLLLEEWTVVAGEPVRQRVAVDVDAGERAVARDLDDAETSIDVQQGGGSTLRLAPGSAPPGPFFVLDEAPPGFEHVGRYSVIPPQAEAFADPMRRGTIVASTADVWVRGIDVLVVDQGGTLEQRTVFEPDPRNPTADAGAAGTGELIISLRGSEVRALRPSARFVRVYGTLPTAELFAVARALVETEGNELVVEPG